MNQIFFQNLIKIIIKLRLKIVSITIGIGLIITYINSNKNVLVFFSFKKKKKKKRGKEREKIPDLIVSFKDIIVFFQNDKMTNSQFGFNTIGRDHIILYKHLFKMEFNGENGGVLRSKGTSVIL